MYGHPDAARHSIRMPYNSLLILMFLNHCILVKTSLINNNNNNKVYLNCKKTINNNKVYKLYFEL